jgi:hypothetical protein
MVTRIRNINPAQLAIVEGAIGVIFGLIAGIFFALIGFMGPGGYGMGGYGMGGYGMGGYGLLSIIILPIMYGIGGFVSGFITGIVYNFVARSSGGIEFTLETIQTTTAP